MAAKTLTPTIHEALADAPVKLTELVERFTTQVAAVAWAKGEIELGRRQFCMTGPVTRNADLASVVIESPEVAEWTGPKTQFMAGLSAVLNETLPTVGRYYRYVQVTDAVTGELTIEKESISREQALELAGYVVRLTDKGMAALGGNT